MTNDNKPPLGSPTAEDLAAVAWQPLVAANSARSCEAMWSALHERFRASEDLAERRVLRLLIHVAGLVVRQQDRKDGPLRPRFTGLEVSTLADPDFAAIKAFLSCTDLHPDLRARLLDVLFLRKQGKPDIWRHAPMAYLDAARTIAASGDLGGVAERLMRALALARVFRSDSDRQAVADFVKRLLDEGSVVVPSPDHLALVRLQCTFDDTDNRELGERCERWATLARETGERAAFVRAICDTAAHVYGKGDSKVEKRRMQLAAVESYVREADEAQHHPLTPRIAEAHFLEQAIQALRKISDTRKQRDKLHRRLLKVQKSVPSEFGRVSGPSINMSKLALASIAEVSGKSFRDALFRLALFTHVPRQRQLREEAIATSKQNLLTHLIPRVITDKNGRVIKKIPGGSLTDDPSADPAILAAMHESARFQRAFVAKCSINPARQQIASEHSPELADVAGILQDSPFVGADRVESFSIGVHAGLRGDLVTAGHVLVPQVEHAVRSVIAARGGSVSTIDENGIQNWILLGTLLEAPEALQAFGEDHLFCLQGVLARDGSNLRNEIAHGLVTDNGFWTAEVLYLWWLVLQLCLLPVAAIESEGIKQREVANGPGAASLSDLDPGVGST